MLDPNSFFKWPITHSLSIDEFKWLTEEKTESWFRIPRRDTDIAQQLSTQPQKEYLLLKMY